MSQTKIPAIPILDLRPEVDALWDEINAAIQGVLKSTAFIMGEEVRLFEKEVAAYLNVKHAIGVNSGTDALIIGLRALGIGEGDEVITTPFSFFATAESISSVGATPVFVDIDDFNIDVSKIEVAITERTRAIMPVHLYGQPANMEAIMHLAKTHNLKVIEDCAQSFGARYQEQHTGTIGHVGAYSFFPSKNLGAYGDGGLLVTNDDQLAETARMLRVHGSKKKYYNEALGYNSRLDTIQAAILRVKLSHIETWNEHRRKVAARYTELLSSDSRVIAPAVTEGHVFHQYTIRVKAQWRDRLIAQLEEQGIGTMVYYPIPQHELPFYRGQFPDFPVSEQRAKEVLSLPIGHYMNVALCDHVVQTIREALDQFESKDA